jgi:Coenzyme PQQ synthesis protein D (PqqD)
MSRIDKEVVMPRLAERIADALIEVQIEDGLVGLSMQSNRCYGMNLTASRIWALLETPQSPDQITDALCAEYQVPRAQAATAVEATLAQLEREGLVRIGQ